LIEGKVALAGNRGTPEELKEIEGLDIPLKDNYSFVTLHSGALLASRPIYNPEGKNIGYLAICDFSGNVSEARRSAIIFSIVVGAGFLLLVLLASGLLQRWLLVPLNALNQDVHRLVSGKREAERKWPQDQIGALAESLVKLYRESQEARQKAEADSIWFRGIIESSQDILAIFDREGKLVDANKAAEAFFSTSKKQFLGLEPEEVLKRLNIDPKTISFRFWEGLKEAYFTGKETVYEGYFSAMDRQMLISFLPLSLGNELKGVILTLKDITPLRRLEIERRTLVEAVAHDLGSPITSLLAAVELMKKEYNSPPSAGYLSGMENNLLVLRNLVHNLVNFNRLEAGMIKVEPVPTDLCRLLKKVYSMFQPLARSRNLNFTLDCPPDLPSLRVDPVRLEEACSNLISNSLKYTPPGGLVLVRAEKINSSLRLTFQDTGYGIPPEEQDFVFQRFRQGKMGKGAGGSGLGLFITKSLVELMGGTIELASAKDRGTIVTLSFPLNQQISDSGS